MTRVHCDLSRVPISVAPSPATSGTSLGVTDTNAAYLPDTYPYWATLVPTGVAPTRANSEIVKVTAGSSSGGTTTLTIVRAQGIPVTTAQTVTTSFDIYDANSAEANIGLNSLIINETPSGTVDGSNAAFDTASTYVAGSIQVYRDGQLMKGGGADYTETDNNTITFTVAPVTGSVLLVTYQHTVSTTGNADTVDGYHANATPTASNIPVLDASALLPTPALMSGGWMALGACTYEGADAPTYTVSFASDMTAILGAGMRIKLTDSTVKYFIITAVGAYSGGKTIITVYGGTDYTLSGGAITLPYFSYQKAPLGFPLSPAKWTQETILASDQTQATPTLDVWYNVGSFSLIIPIGAWKLSYAGVMECSQSGAAAMYPRSTLSTGNNTESNINFTNFFLSDSIKVNTFSFFAEETISLAAKATYYCNLRTSSTGTVTGLRIYGTYGKSKIRAVSAYL